jgi:hypothetical protein
MDYSEIADDQRENFKKILRCNDRQTDRQSGERTDGGWKDGRIYRKIDRPEEERQKGPS